MAVEALAYQPRPAMAPREAARPFTWKEQARNLLKKVGSLSHVPAWFERKVNGEAKLTSWHELHHGFIAMRKNIPVKLISCIPQGNSLGRTVFAGHINSYDFAVTAAGGMVNPSPDNPATGFGMDELQVRYFGDGTLGPVQEAKRIIGSISSKVHEKAAEILACLGEVSGGLIADIYRRAELEVDLEMNGVKLELVEFQEPLVADPIIKEPENKKKENKETIIEHYPYGGMKIQYVTDGKIDYKREEFYCGHCKAVNFHHPNCPLADKLTLGPEKKIIEFPKNRNIFDSERVS